MTVQLFITLYVLAGLIGAAGFVLLYAAHPMTRDSWWRSPVGQNLMAYSATAALFYLQSTITTWFPHWEYKNVARVVLATMAIIVVWWRLALLIREIRIWHRKKAQNVVHENVLDGRFGESE